MPFDGIATKAVVNELQKILIGGKINKVFEPQKDEIIIDIYNNSHYMLDISANPTNCRICLTTSSKPNPTNAPSFCMLLRKYLVGGKITNISSFDLERTIEIDFECYNELNDLCLRKLFVQIMNRQSNIVLTNENNIIIDCIKHSENFMPAHPYIQASITKHCFIELKTFDDFQNIINSKLIENINLINQLTSQFIGFSKPFIKNCLEELNIDNCKFSNNDLEKLYMHLMQIIQNLNSQNVYLKIYEKDYVISKINIIETSNSSINLAIDDYYTNLEKKANFQNHKNKLFNLANTNLNKYIKRLENINSKLAECNNMDIYKIYGELLTANLYRLNPYENLSTIDVENYYENNKILTIPLDNKINLQKNIKKFFKKYNKLKNAQSIVFEQKIDTEKEINYFESIIFSIENASSLEDILDIDSELIENKKINQKNKQTINKKTKQSDKNITLTKVEFQNYTIYVGKNNIQNDYLSTKFANKNDIWFHTKIIHGCHIILRNSKNELIENIPFNVLYESAKLAKENSKGKFSSNVEVDYCYAKYVKKPSGSNPGFVIYTNYKTINVD